MLRQTSLRLISVIGYSLSLSSLTLATLLMGMLRSVAGGEGVSGGHAIKIVHFVWRKGKKNSNSTLLQVGSYLHCFGPHFSPL